MSRDIEATFKLLFIGESGVGKSSILLRFTDDCFLPPEDTGATIGVDFKVKVRRIKDKRYKITIWDTAGQERFRTLTSSYYRGAQGIFIVYDVTDRNTFTALEKWLEELNTYCTDPNVVKMLVGNKIDMAAERQVEREEAESFAHKHGALYYECSAKTSEDVETAIDELVTEIINRPLLWKRNGRNTQVVGIGGESEGDAAGPTCAC